MSIIVEDPKAISLSEKEASSILGLTVKSLQKRRWEGLPPPYLKIGRKVRYRLSDILEYLETCTVLPRVADKQK